MTDRIRTVLPLIVLSLVASTALAGVGEIEIHIIPNRQPDWYYGDGNFQLTLRSNAYTSWGSFNAYLDVDMSPDFGTSNDVEYLEIAPIFSLSKLAGLKPPGWLTDVGLTVQYNDGLMDNRYQLIPTAWLGGIVLSFGGSAMDVLDLHLLYKTFSAYEEDYEIPYLDGNQPALWPVHDVWPIKDGWQVTLEWAKTWRTGKGHEIFARGFFDYWIQSWATVEQWPDVYPGFESKGPTWLHPASSVKIVTQPQFGYRFGYANQFAVGTELELTHNLYREPDDDGEHLYRLKDFTFQMSLFFSVRF